MLLRNRGPLTVRAALSGLRSNNKYSAPLYFIHKRWYAKISADDEYPISRAYPFSYVESDYDKIVYKVRVPKDMVMATVMWEDIWSINLRRIESEENFPSLFIDIHDTFSLAQISTRFYPNPLTIPYEMKIDGFSALIEKIKSKDKVQAEILDKLEKIRVGDTTSIFWDPKKDQDKVVVAEENLERMQQLGLRAFYLGSIYPKIY